MIERTEWIQATLDDIFWIIVNSIPIHITKFNSESIKSKFTNGNCQIICNNSSFVILIIVVTFDQTFEAYSILSAPRKLCLRFPK